MIRSFLGVLGEIVSDKKLINCCYLYPETLTKNYTAVLPTSEPSPHVPDRVALSLALARRGGEVDVKPLRRKGRMAYVRRNLTDLKKTVAHLIWGDPSSQWGVRVAKGGGMDPQIRSKSAKSMHLIWKNPKINGVRGVRGTTPKPSFFS